MNLRKSQASGPRPTIALKIVLVAIVAGLVAMPGCGGCFSRNSPAAKTKTKDGKEKTTDEELAELEKKRTKKVEKPKDDFEPLAIRMLPSGDPVLSLKQQPMLVKPGHWSAVSQTAKANNFDFPGEMVTFVEQTSSNMPLEVENTTSRLGSWCPAILPKGQSKRIESLFYVPRRETQLSGVYSLRSEVRGIRGGRTETFTTTISPALKDYQHTIVVLASGGTTPAAYQHFDRLLSVKPGVEDKEDTLRYYYVFRPTIDRGAPLPSHPLAWTTIAYLFWDDVDPGLLTNQQQQALVDWLHWGGQLVISGPASLDKLKGSFLAPFLPGESVKSRELDQAAFDELNQTFSIARDPQRVARLTKAPAGEHLRRVRVLPERPMVGLELKLHSEGRMLEGTGNLVAERRLGGGRIVVTCFPLTDVRIKQWKSFDNFFNSALLRRPARIFREAQPNAYDSIVSSQLAVDWDNPNLRKMRSDARLGSTLRYFTRDVGEFASGKEPQWLAPLSAAPAEDAPAANTDPFAFQRGRRGAIPPGRVPPGAFMTMPYPGAEPAYDTSAKHPGIDDWHFAGYGRKEPKNPTDPNRLTDATGVAAWSDDGAASSAARHILTHAAGIEIPQAKFVLKVLVVYLLVLVPLNWLIFWTIGRVEWAWIAAPIIALGGAAGVVRLAQLDIGFARSRTEVAVLELQGGYERAHLTRYTALYTSLSSSYTLAFDEPSSLAAPFATGQRDESLLNITQYTDVSFRRDKDTSLAGVQVSSNSTGMAHCEQMLPLGDSPKVTETLKLVGDDTKGYSVSNTTDLVIRDVGVFRRVDQPQPGARPQPAQIEAAYVATIEPGRSATLQFKPLAASSDTVEERTSARNPDEEENPTFGRRQPLYPSEVWLNEWNKVAILAPEGKASESGDETTDAEITRIRLHLLAKLASSRLRLLPGDVRLIGWTDQRLPGMRIRPEAPQNRTYTLVLAHLVRGDLPPVRPDRNVAEDYLSHAFFDSDVPVEVPPEAETPQSPTLKPEL